MPRLIRSNRSRGFLKQLLIGIFVIGLAAITVSAQAKPFLSAKGNDQRCKSLLEWLDTMEEIIGPPELRVWNDLVDRVSPAFADDIFIPAIGKSYSALSNSEKKRIGKYLKKCERKPYEFGFLTIPFAKKRDVDPRSAERWKQGISRAKNGLDALNKKRAEVAMWKASIEDKERVKTIRATTKKEYLPHYAGRILTETPDFRIHEFRFNTHDVDNKCAPYSLSSDEMEVSLVFKNLGFRVTEQSMTPIFRNTLIPLQQSECPQAELIYAKIFFDGVYLDSAANELSELDIKRDDRDRNGIQELWFATASLSMSSYSSSRGDIFIRYFKDRSPDLSDTSEYETLSDLRIIAARQFMTEQDWRNRQQLLANMLRVPGFEFARSAERVLATGDNHVDYYTKNPELVGAALMGYSWAIVKKCQRQVPGGTTSLRYSLSRDGFEEDSAIFTVPRDFVPIFEKLGNSQGLRIDYMVVSAKKQPAYTDVIKLIDAKGCSNIAVTSYHRNLSEVLNKVRADWRNRRGLLNLFRSIMMPEQYR